MFISISFGFPVPEAAGLLIPAITALLQENVVPAVPLKGTYEKRVLLQIVVVDSELLSVGVGNIEILTF